MHRIWVLMFLSFLSTHTLANEYSLTSEEADFVRRLMAKDKLLADLPKAQNGLETLNKLLSAGSAGPIKIALQWNQVAIKAWRTANSALEKIGKLSICNEIDLMISYETKNTGFFEELSEARGCKETATEALAPADQSDVMAAVVTKHSQSTSEGAVIYSAEVAKVGDGWIIRPAPCVADVQFYAGANVVSGFPGKRRLVRCPNGDRTEVQDVKLVSDGSVTILSISSVAGALAIADDARLSASRTRVSLENTANKKFARRSSSATTTDVQLANLNIDLPSIKLPSIPNPILYPIPSPSLPQPPKLPDAFDAQYPACIPVRQQNYWSLITQGVSRGREMGLYSNRDECRDRIIASAAAISTNLGIPQIAPAIGYGSDCGCKWEFR